MSELSARLDTILPELGPDADATIERVQRETRALAANPLVSRALNPDAPRSTARKLCDWMTDPSLLVPPAVVLPYLAIEGRVTLLSGREKVGKSELLGGAVADASRGADVLGAPMVAPVRTLWYAIDEPSSDAVRRFARLNADPERIILCDTPRTFSDLHKALALDLAAYPGVQIVVLDTLSKLLAMTGVNPNQAHDVEPFIVRLVDTLHEARVAGILSYHTGKSGREYRGSTAIGATVDEILTLRKRGTDADADDFDDDGTNDVRRLLVQDGRNLRGRVQLTYRDGSYVLHRDTTDPADRIVDALRDNGTVAGRANLVKLAGTNKAAGLRAIGELVAVGRVVEKHGKLSLGPGSAVPKPARAGTDAGTGKRRSRVPGSGWFSEGGTGPEPTPEPAGLVGGAPGSGSRNPRVSEIGTEPDGMEFEL